MRKTVTPKLRFPEFLNLGGWETTPLKDIAEHVSTKNSDGNVTRVLTNSAESGVLDQRDYFDRDIATAGKVDGYYIVDRGDYVYNPRTSTIAPVGPISRNNLGKGVMSPLYTIFRFSADKTDFYEHYFRSTGWHSYLKSTANTGVRHDRMSITTSAFMQMPVPTPPLSEQQKIADCLTSLDEVISAQGQKVEALKTYKRGLMQQLFPREGETLPRLRFPEFRDAPEWTEKMLEDIASISSGMTPLRSNPEFYESGTIPWVKTADLNNSFIDETEEYITPKARATINPAGSVLVAMYGGFNQIGRTGCLRIAAATNQALSVLRVNHDKVLPVYLLAWLNAKVDDWKRIASSSRKDPNITGTDVAQFPIQIPSMAEQQRITDCLSSLDTQITAESEKLDALKTHKKGLMQQLFPIMDKP